MITNCYLTHLLYAGFAGACGGLVSGAAGAGALYSGAFVSTGLYGAAVVTGATYGVVYGVVFVCVTLHKWCYSGIYFYTLHQDFDWINIRQTVLWQNDCSLFDPCMADASRFSLFFPILDKHFSPYEKNKLSITKQFSGMKNMILKSKWIGYVHH